MRASSLFVAVALACSRGTDKPDSVSASAPVRTDTVSPQALASADTAAIRDTTPLDSVVQVSVGVQACAVTRSGAAYCWEEYGDGKHGYPKNVGRPPDPKREKGDHHFTQISMAGPHLCALDSDDHAWCWGTSDGDGLLGTGKKKDQSQEPQRVVGDRAFTQISAGGWHVCALDSARRAWCWGSGTGGQLGVPSEEVFAEPTAVVGDHVFTQISAVALHTCAVDQQGYLFCWGGGRGTRTGGSLALAAAASVPRRVQGIEGVRSLDGHCVVDGEGAVWCWREPFQAQRVESPVAFVSVASDDGRRCALTKEGVAYCWGYNSEGELGVTPDSTIVVDGRSFVVTKRPLPVKTDIRFRQLSVGDLGVCGVGTDGRAYCWDTEGMVKQKQPRAVVLP